MLRLDPSELCIREGDGAPRLAKDEDYASAVLKAWTDEVDGRRGGGDGGGSVSSPLVYECETDGSSLHGHVYRPSPPREEGDDAAEEKCVPGIVLFHTGAGPQDVFLRWKADSLVNERETFGPEGCVVLIADIIGDASGWAWHDKERYAEVRKSILVPDENGERNKLAGRVRVAVDAVASQPAVDPDRIGAMGFCLGGHPILELARMKDRRVGVMATFHGVFDGVRDLSHVERSEEADKSKVLVCTGMEDPFVPHEDLDAAARMFSDLGVQGRGDGVRADAARLHEPGPGLQPERRVRVRRGGLRAGVVGRSRVFEGHLTLPTDELSLCVGIYAVLCSLGT